MKKLVWFEIAGLSLVGLSIFSKFSSGSFNPLVMLSGKRSAGLLPAPAALSTVVIASPTPADRKEIGAGDVVTVKFGDIGPDFLEFKGLTEEQAFAKMTAIVEAAQKAGLDLENIPDEKPFRLTVTRVASLNQILREANNPNQPADNPMNEGPVILAHGENAPFLRGAFAPAAVIAIDKKRVGA